MLILLLFFSSGATALVYEVLWSKYLTIMLGSTVQAQTVVLAVFMGGLAIGNRLFGRRSISIKNPLLVYGILEIAIGAYAYFFPLLYRGADWSFIAVGTRFYGSYWAILLLKLFISVTLLVLPTILMGGTLPLIAAWIEKQPGFESGARVGIFYAVNSLGAVFGAGMAGFVLIQNFGMSSSLELAALVNFAIGGVAGVASRIQQLQLNVPARKEPAVTAAHASDPPASLRWFALMVALTGGVSMGLEVLSSRALALIAGGSLQAFALVLMSFILGIGLGSMVISSSRMARIHGLSTIYLLLVGAASLVLANVVFIEKWTIVYSTAHYGLAPNPIGYAWHQIGVALMAFLILGLPAACLGAVVPLSIRLIQGPAGGLGDQVGRLLTANTVGAVLGVVITGFLLMPLIGLRGALATLAFVLLGITALIAFQRQNRATAVGVMVLLGLSAMAVASTGQGWRLVIGSGIYRLRNIQVTQDWFDNRREHTRLLFYKDSADATVAVEQSQFPNEPTKQLVLRTNGKPEASTTGDLSTQYLIAHLPIMANPSAKNVFILGFGSGISAGAILNHPVEKLTVAENCHPILEAGHLFAEWNRGVLTNNRVAIRYDDARTVLKLSPSNYDVIISEPSNPWVAGVGSIFSREFYDMCASRLAEGGMMAQWFHCYEMSDYVVLLILRTFSSTFPYVEIWDTQQGDIVMLGAKRPWVSNPSRYQQCFERPLVRRDLAQININSAVALWVRQLASQETAAAIPGDGPIQQDEFPILEYEAPKAFFIGNQALKLTQFDERTANFPLADKEKIAALRALPVNTLIETFQFYSTSSSEVDRYLVGLGRGEESAPSGVDPRNQIIFRSPDRYAEDPPASANASPEFAECLRLEARMLRDPTNWRDPARRIEQVLRDMIGKDKLTPRDFYPAYFAAVLTRFAIGDKDIEAALRALRLGMVFNSSDEQLLFLSRVLDRVVPAEQLEEYRKRDQQKELTVR